jgi:hypothetical protein
MIIPGQFGFNCPSDFREEAFCNIFAIGDNVKLNPAVVAIWNLLFGSGMKFQMAATAGLSLTLDPMGKMFQNVSSLKPLGQLKPNCPGMIIGRSSTKFCLP